MSSENAKKPQKFPVTPAEKVFETPIFSVQKQRATALRTPDELDIFTLRCSHWVNVVPVTTTGEIVLICQHRFGSDSLVYEVPGGAVDVGEKDFTMAALRELEEETGLTSQRILALPDYFPNPALQGNSIGYFVAFDVIPAQGGAHQDPFENIEPILLPWREALVWARQGRVKHALSALALLLAEPLLIQKFGSKDG